MILVGAADAKNAENELLKKICHKQKFNYKVFFKSAKWVYYHLYFILIRTTNLNAYCLQKVDFCIYEPNNFEVIENSSKAPLFSSLKCT